MKNNYLLESEDNYLVEMKIQEIIKNNDFLGSPYHVYNMDEDKLSQVLEDLDTYGLFSSKKIIEVNHIENLSNDTSDKDIKHFIQYFMNPLDTNLVFVTANKLNNTKKLTKDLKKYLEVVNVSCNALDFVKGQLKDYSLESGVARKLVDLCLEDIGRLYQECWKLKMYRYDTKKISLEDVNTLVIRKLGDSKDLTFEFVRVLASKDKKEALKKYHELQEYSIDSLPLIGLLASQFLIMYQVKLLEKKSHSNSDIATILGEKPYRIQKTRELTKYYSLDELGSILRSLSDMDLKIKTTDVDGSFLIELFILKNT